MYFLMSSVVVSSLTLSLPGIPMHLTFFVHPYEVLKTPLLSSREKQASVPSGVGVSGRVCIEKSAQVCRLSIDRNLFK